MPNLRALLDRWRKPKLAPPPWWRGYVKFPPTLDGKLSIVLSNGHIIVLDDTCNTITVYVNHSWFLNRPQFHIELHDPPEW